MADNHSTNEFNEVSKEPKVRHLEEIFDDMETFDYEPSGSVSAGNPLGSGASARRDDHPEMVRSTDRPQSRSTSSDQPARRQASGQARPRTASADPSRRQTASSAGRSQSIASRPQRSGSSAARNASAARSQDPSAARSRSSAGRSRQNTYKRRKKKFKKMLLLYIAALVVILIVGSIIFSIYLASYENGLQSHVAESIVKSYESQDGIVSFVSQNADKTTIIDNVDETAQVYASNIAGKTISYIENSDFRAAAPSYDIIADGSTVAKVTLGHEGNNSKWVITSLNISDYLPNSMSVTVEAPVGSSVMINDRTLDSSYISSTAVPEVLQNSLAFIPNPPQYDTYHLSGLVSDPVINVTGSDGSQLALTKTDSSYIASQTADADFVASVEDRVYAAIDSYATYFINMSFDLKNYIALDSDLWTYIFGSDTMDPIATSLYMFEDILSYDFIERSADNYVKYGDDCFTVDIKYALDMVFTDPTYSDENQKMDATWVFVIDPYDGSWCISDIINH